MKRSYLTNSKNIWLLLAALSLQLFLFVGDETQGTARAPFLPRSEWVVETTEHPIISVKLFHVLKNHYPPLPIVLSPPPFAQHCIIACNQFSRVQFNANQRLVLNFNIPAFFPKQKIPSRSSENESAFLFLS